MLGILHERDVEALLGVLGRASTLTGSRPGTAALARAARKAGLRSTRPRYAVRAETSGTSPHGVRPRLVRVPPADVTLPELALSTSVLDRRGDLRADPGLLPRLLADPATAVLRLVGDRVAVDDGHDGATTRPCSRAPERRRHRPARALPRGGGRHGHTSGWSPTTSRRPWPTTPPGAPCGRRAPSSTTWGASTVATTLALANWHRSHGHCPRCGTPTEPVLAGWIRRCPADGSEHYPRTDMAVIMAVVDADDRILLARGKGFRGNGMSVLAGFVEPGESLAAAVAREVAEEVGVEVTDVTYLGDQPWPFPSSLMLGFTARARSAPTCGCSRRRSRRRGGSPATS